MQVQGIGASNQPGSAAARAAFIHDATAMYMAKGRVGGWDEALKWITDANQPGAFGGAEIKGIYQKAANQGPNATNWLQRNWVQVNEDGSITRPWKSGTGGGRPPAPGSGQPAPAGNQPPPAPKIDQKAVDAAIWGR